LRRLVVTLTWLVILSLAWPIVERIFADTNIGSFLNTLGAELDKAKDRPKYEAAVEGFFDEIYKLLASLDSSLELPKDKPQEAEEPEKIRLQVPDTQTFSVRNIELGDTRAQVEAMAGREKRASLNEYGVNWYAYHENYRNFFMAAYDENNRVVCLYTNQDLLSSTKGIKIGTPKEEVRNRLGEPLSRIEKESFYYQVTGHDYDVYFIDGSYITIFYDKHENNTVTAVQLIAGDLEKKKQDFYTDPSPQLVEGFEYQLFDLTNAARVAHGVNPLTWNEHVKYTAREHSLDMAVNNYFDHVNLSGQSPFDRMQEDRIVFAVAGENLAYGQFSSIFAHEGLMNSLGHRENILKSEFKYLGVGVAFNSESKPYYTENFFAN
jgi:uncharacterized protein YkwD